MKKRAARKRAKPSPALDRSLWACGFTLVAVLALHTWLMVDAPQREALQRQVDMVRRLFPEAFE